MSENVYQIDFNKPESVHFIGIGGISMSGLAEILLKEHFTVTGSDSKESPLTPKETEGSNCATGCICPPGTERKCTTRRQIPGSVSFVPSVAGLIIAGEVIKDLLKA